MSWTSALLRSVVWLGAAVIYAYLKAPAGGRVSALRADALGWLGAAVTGAGLVLHGWSNAMLARAETVPGQAATRLVVDGPFRIMRNPIYLAGITLIVGVGLLYAPWRLRDLAGPAAVFVFFHLRVVRAEEPALQKQFGPRYDDYCRRVPRWLPGLSRRSEPSMGGR